MNANQLINMVMRLFLRKVISKGLDAGMDYATRKRQPADASPDAERRNQQQARDTSKRAKQAMRAGRRRCPRAAFRCAARSEWRGRRCLSARCSRDHPGPRG